MYNYGYDYNYGYGATAGAAAAGVGIFSIFLVIFEITFWLLFVAYIVLGCIGYWKTFTKMGRKGYEGLISGYNDVILFQAVKMPIWNYFLLLVPVYQFVISIKRGIELAKKFGKSTAFGVVGLGLFPGVGMFLIGMSKDVKYKG